MGIIRGPGRRVWIQAALGFATGGICLWLAFRLADSISFAQAWPKLQLSWAPTLIALYWLQLGLRIVRWRGLLRHDSLGVGTVSLVLISGYAVNFLLPARIGELFRADLLKRMAAIPRSEGLGSIFVERLLDATALVIALFAGLVLLPDGLAFSPALTALALLSFAGLLSVILLTWKFPLVIQITRRAGWSWLTSKLEDAEKAILVVRSRQANRQILLTVLIYLLELAVSAAAIQLVGVSVSISMVLLVMSTASLSTLLPSSPGFVGSLQLAFVLSFAVFNIDASQGVLAATALQVLLYGPLVLVGLTLLFVSSSRALIVDRRTNKTATIDVRTD